MSTADKTRWLDAEEQRTWRQLSTMILRLQPVLSAQLQREFGISHFEYLIMACSVRNAGIDAADERTGHDHRQLAAAVVPGRRPPGKTRLDIPAA